MNWCFPKDRIARVMAPAILLAVLGVIASACDSNKPEGQDYPLVVAGSVSAATAATGLFRMAANGDRAQLYESPVNLIRRPVCSSDGQRIAFEFGQGAGFHQAALWYLQDGTVRPVAFEDPTEDRVVSGRIGSWSPDGRKLLYSTPDYCVAGCYGGDLAIADVETGVVTMVTHDDFSDRSPAWSPDGRWIAFSSDRGGDGETDIWVVAPDGTGLRRVSSPRGLEHEADELTWGPGRADVTYRDASNVGPSPNFEYRILNIETGAVRDLEFAGIDDYTRGFTNIRWTADGTSYVASALRITTNSIL